MVAESYSAKNSELRRHTQIEYDNVIPKQGIYQQATHGERQTSKAGGRFLGVENLRMLKAHRRKFDPPEHWRADQGDLRAPGICGHLNRRLSPIDSACDEPPAFEIDDQGKSTRPGIKEQIVDFGAIQLLCARRTCRWTTIDPRSEMPFTGAHTPGRTSNNLLKSIDCP